MMNSLNLNENNIQKAIKEWNILKENNKYINIEDINNIAKKNNILTGKWLIYRNNLQIDTLWNNISINCIKGLLGPSVKVSPNNNYNNHVICVYTNNYLDEENVLKIRENLKNIGVKNKISYKPDIYTYFEIYQKNIWKIKPTIYTL